MADFTREEIEEKLEEYAEMLASREEEDEFLDEPDEDIEETAGGGRKSYGR